MRNRHQQPVGTQVAAEQAQGCWVGDVIVQVVGPSSDVQSIRSESVVGLSPPTARASERSVNVRTVSRES